MRSKLLVLLVVALLAVALPAATVFAQGATSQPWTSSITYYTPSASGGTMVVTYYASDGTSYSSNALTLAGHKAGSLLIGTVSSVPAGFAGSAVVSADVPVVATYVQFVNGTESGTFGRALYTAFGAVEGATPFYVPTFIYQKGTTTKVGVQNLEAFDVTAHLALYAAGSSTPVTKDVDIKSQASYIFTGADVPGVAAGWSGSLVVTANKVGDVATPGKVVAAAQETSDAGRQAYAFEGVASGANKIYMASMLCKLGAAQQISYYAIQNTGPNPANVTITAYNTSGTTVGSHTITGLAVGAKTSVNPCQFSTPVADNTSGSAVIESTGGSIIAMGKISANDGLTTAFVGSAAGATRVAAPYIRWAANNNADFRSYIAIMNVGTVAANNVQVTYYDGNGNAVATHNLTASGALNPLVKRNSDAATAGALTAGAFGFSPSGGAVEVTSDQPVVVVVRLHKTVSGVAGVTGLGEDYGGTPVAP